MFASRIDYEVRITGASVVAAGRIPSSGGAAAGAVFHGCLSLAFQ